MSNPSIIADFVTVEEALALIQANLPAPSATLVPTIEAAGLVLAKDLVSPVDMPPFNQSAMDGYALKLWDQQSYQVVDEVKAGDGHNPELQPGEACRIFTGAAVPDSANAVVMQEHTIRKDLELVLTQPVKAGANIRPLGEQIRQGEKALPKGTPLSSAAIGFLFSLGIESVRVFKKPSVAILTTGSELLKAGQPLTRGKVYDSNGPMLSAALNELGYAAENFETRDDYEPTRDLIARLLDQYDLLLISGGISVGDYDFSGKALKELGTRQIFYKVNQKPGKPLFFGRYKNVPVLALPGNPASALICFYVYAVPLLRAMSGASSNGLRRLRLKSKSGVSLKGSRAQFLKARVLRDEVEILDAQSSAMLSSFSLANALVYVKDCPVDINPGDLLEVICLPNFSAQ